VTSTLGRPKGISVRRLQRIEQEIAPLVARGLTIHQVAEVVGISAAMAAKDCAVVKERWNAAIDDRLEIARGELIAKHDEIYKIAMEGYARDKRSTKFLELASKELECLGRLLGQAGPSINLHNHSHSVTVTAEAVGDLFKPLDAGTYSEMVAAKVLPPSEPEELPDIEMEAESVGTDDWGSAKVHEGVPAVENADEPGAPQGKNRRIQHPLRG